MRPIVPCRECKDRTPTCHTGCERYEKYKEELKKFKDETRKGSRILVEWSDTEYKRRMGKRLERGKK